MGFFFSSGISLESVGSFSPGEDFSKAGALLEGRVLLGVSFVGLSALGFPDAEGAASAWTFGEDPSEGAETFFEAAVGKLSRMAWRSCSTSAR